MVQSNQSNVSNKRVPWINSNKQHTKSCKRKINPVRRQNVKLAEKTRLFDIGKSLLIAVCENRAPGCVKFITSLLLSEFLMHFQYHIYAEVVLKSL